MILTKNQKTLYNPIYEDTKPRKPPIITNNHLRVDVDSTINLEVITIVLFYYTHYFR